MTDKPKKQEEGLFLEELEAQSVERLPDREEMSLVDVTVAIPFNMAVSDILSGDSTAAESDEQGTTNE